MKMDCKGNKNLPTIPSFPPFFFIFLLFYCRMSKLLWQVCLAEVKALDEYQQRPAAAPEYEPPYLYAAGGRADIPYTGRTLKRHSTSRECHFSRLKWHTA